MKVTERYFSVCPTGKTSLSFQSADVCITSVNLYLWEAIIFYICRLFWFSCFSCFHNHINTYGILQNLFSDNPFLMAKISFIFVAIALTLSTNVFCQTDATYGRLCNY